MTTPFRTVPNKELLESAQRWNTPLYVYLFDPLEKPIQELLKEGQKLRNFHLFYAMKANGNPELLKLMASLGCGADIVSQGELYGALQAGFTPKKIVFSGVGKTQEELHLALEKGIRRINIESIDELKILQDKASSLGIKAPVALRVNPNVDPKTHPYISTGLKKNKFGLDESEVRQIFMMLPQLSHIQFDGLSCHIGSQITSLNPFREAWSYLLDFSRQCPFPVRSLDLGGGLGISYGSKPAPSMHDFISEVISLFQDFPGEIGLELGRSLVGNHGILLTKVITIKERQPSPESNVEKFIVLDAGMNDLIRPALYQAQHQIVPLNHRPSRIPQRVSFVGPVCESSDVFLEETISYDLQPGDTVALLDTGAYGFSMGSTYNSRPRPAECALHHGQLKLLRPRQTLESLWKE